MQHGDSMKTETKQQPVIIWLLCITLHANERSKGELILHLHDKLD